MIQSRRSLAMACGGLFFLLILAGGAGGLSPCGDCIFIGAWECEYIVGMGEECHGWENGSGEESPRCGDPHTPIGDYYVGEGLCEEEHGGTCGNPDCSSEEEDLDDDLAAAVAASDVVALENLLSANPYAWVEVNEYRTALQILTRCAQDPIGSVAWHFPIEPEGVSFWAEVLSDSEILDPPEVGVGNRF